MIIKIALLQLKRNWKYSSLIVSNLFIGMLSFVLLVSIKDSVLESVYESSKNYLGADISLYSRQKIDEIHLKKTEELLPSNFKKTQLKEMYTMVKGDQKSRLCLLVAFEMGYPFYGDFKLQNKGVLKGESYKSILNEDKVWVYPEVLKQLNLKVGDSIRIGEASYIIDDVVLEASGQSSGWASMAPLIYLSFSSLDKTQLIQKGSTLWQSFLYKLPSEVDVLSLEKINEFLTDPSLKVQSHIKAGEQASRLVLYFLDFLGLSGLVVLFLATIGVYFVLQSYLNTQLNAIAVYKSVGMVTSKIQKMFFVQFILLAIISYLLSIASINLILPIVNKLLFELSFFELKLKLSLTSTFISILVLAIIVVFLSWPIIHLVSKVKVKQLFGDHVNANILKWDNRVFHFLPLIIFFGGISVWMAKSWVTGGIFWISLILLTGLAASFWLAFAKVINLFIMPKKWAWYFKSWLRRPLPTLLAFISLTLSLVLINFLTYLDGNLSQELVLDNAKGQPSLFIFDIQEEQLNDVVDVSKKFNFEYNSLAPMIRAKLTKVNDKNFEKIKENSVFETREREREERFRNRGMNLTIRDRLSYSETIVDGDNYVGEYNNEGLPPISLEKKFAERLDLNLLDKLTFEVQGVEVQAIVKSIRTIKWTSFEPNFFIQFPKGVLELAPKTYIATVPSLNENILESFQSELFEVVPNASVINVKRLVNRIANLVKKMIMALKFITLLAIVSGLLIIFSISQNQVKQKTKDVILLKWLGFTQNKILKLFVFEFTFISIVSSLLALFLAQILIMVIGKFVFQAFWVGKSILPFLIILVISSVTSILVTLIVKKVFDSKTKDMDFI